VQKPVDRPVDLSGGRHQRVTAAQVTTLARELLGEDNRVSLIYVPADSLAENPANAEVGEPVGASR